jgi:S-adenosylmethionine synthetase
MTTTFMKSPKYLFTSESVTEGHPDKLCDQVSDAIVDALIAQDKTSRIACEAATKTGFVMVFGEVTTQGYVDIDSIVRSVVLGIGYDRGKKGFDGATCGVQTALANQLPHLSTTKPTSRPAALETRV